MDLICRTCLAYNDELEPLFCKKLVDSDYKDITAMILQCTGLKISKDDKLSDTICSQCIDSIIAAFQYRKKVWKSNTILREASKVLDDATGDNFEFENNKIIAVTKPLSIMVINPENFRGVPLVVERDSDALEPQSCKVEPLETPCFDVESTSAIQFDPPSDVFGPIDAQNYIELGPADRHLTMNRLGLTLPDNQRNFRNVDTYIKIVDKSTTLRPFSCTICNQTYEMIGPLRKHLVTNHKKSVLTAFRCKACFKTTLSEKYFRRHLNEAHQPKANSRNFVCDLCGKPFKFRSALAEHLNRHNGVKPFKCELCEFRTVASSELKLHMRTHTGEKPYVCHICGKGYKTSSHRGAHIKEAHSEGRPFECKICGRDYKSRRVYRSHMQIHNPNINIKCGVCHKEFNFKKNLKVHMRQHGEKSFKCTVCEKMFYQKQNCQTHMKKMHNAKM